MTTQRHRIVIEGDDSTNYSAYSPDVPGVVATGATREECEREMREAIGFHLEGLEQEEAGDARDVVKPLFAFEGVSAWYREGRRTVPILDRVSFEIPTGAQVGVWGGRRSGKSTLLRLASGLTVPNEGIVRFEGHDITTMSSRRRGRLMCRGVGLIAAPVWPIQNVRAVDYVGLPLLARGLSRHEASRLAGRLLHQAGMGDHTDALMRSLSLIDRLWVALAHSLALEPSLLLVDEPAMIPSLNESERFLGALRSLAREHHMTLVIASEEITVLQGVEMLMTISHGELHTVERQAEIIAFPKQSATRKDRSNR